MKHTAVLGQGRMGAAMARRLRGAGMPVTVWNRTRDRCEPARDAGAEVAGDPAAAVTGADVVLVMVADAPAVAEVLDAIAGALPEPAVVVQMSTISPQQTRELARRFPAVTLLDAPVAGSVPQVLAGRLRVLAGGEPAVVEAALGVLRRLGTVEPCGGIGGGSAAKLVVNGAMIATGVVLAAAASLARDLGFDEETAKQILAGTVLAPALERYNPSGGDFPVYLAAKDLRLAAQAAADPAVFDTALARLDRLTAADPQTGMWTVVTEALS